MKKNRQKVIIDLVKSRTIETQEELAEALREQGFQVTQATVSRDIRNLKLAKVAGQDGKQHYTVSEQPKDTVGKYLRVLREGYISGVPAGNMIVIRTVTGMAMAVAAALDALAWPEVLGCIAGDDTIFCAQQDVHDTEVVMGRLLEIVGEE